MTDGCGLLHNMSAPPKTVVKYSGLADLTSHPATGSRGAGAGQPGTVTYGLPVRFELCDAIASGDAATILRQLGFDPTADPAAQLDTVIDARAAELPLPDGCVVIPPSPAERRIWRDPLTTLAVLAKCSDHVWLRAKQPAVHGALARHCVTLLVPPAFIDQLPESDE